MSHMSQIEAEITDLSALDAAAKEFGGILVRGQKTHEWYGVSVGDYPLPTGFTKEDLGKCDHAIKLPGVRYEVGVCARRDGKPGYTLLYDFWGCEGDKRHDGHRLRETFGDGLKKLVQSYAACRATALAKARGLWVKREARKDGSIKLTVTGPSL